MHHFHGITFDKLLGKIKINQGIPKNGYRTRGPVHITVMAILGNGRSDCVFQYVLCLVTNRTGRVYKMSYINGVKLCLSKIALLLLACSLIAACSPKEGSEAWCKEMKEKPKSEMTSNELKDFTKHCLFK